METELFKAELNETNLMGANLSRADLSETKGLTIEQLSRAKSLYNCKNLSRKLKKTLKAPEYSLLWEGA